MTARRIIAVLESSRRKPQKRDENASIILWTLLGIGMALFFLQGCATAPQTVEAAAPVEPPLLSLFADARAAKVGDLITVQVTESSRGSNKVTSLGEKETELKADLKNVLSGKTGKTNADFKTTNNYNATSGLERRGNLVANVTAAVTEARPNGLLVIDGRQEIKIEKGEQVIIVHGVVRPEDIGAGNTILSTRLADAKIQYKSKKEPWIHHYGILGWLFNVIF